MDNLNSTLVSLEEMSDMTDMENGTMYNITSFAYILDVTNRVTVCIELPVLCWAVFTLYHQVKADNATPVYVMNLLISDFIQIIGRIVQVIKNDSISYIAFLIGISLSIGFMVCIALERYLLIVHPLWFRCRRTIKHSIFISLVIYAFEMLIFTGLFFSFYVFMIIGAAALLILPLPLLLFFLGATWRAISHSISVPHKEKKRILGTLALVLLSYLILFLPTILLILSIYGEGFSEIDFLKLFTVAFVFLYISPLIDPLLYVLIKKDDKYIVKVPHCYWRLRGHRENRQTSSVPTENITSV
ncbi:G-protein coupled receptor 4-like [Anguilla anguilla]|uniref:G-protein coupled receptor 4-like n=1 Tax=Anguilla anguilla TaxID=7936 RepID=UPI0015AB91FB|nr:G-protein coupled receptor 4-like [Anguilla anguilla]